MGEWPYFRRSHGDGIRARLRALWIITLRPSRGWPELLAHTASAGSRSAADTLAREGGGDRCSATFLEISIRKMICQCSRFIISSISEMDLDLVIYHNLEAYHHFSVRLLSLCDLISGGVRSHNENPLLHYTCYRLYRSHFFCIDLIRCSCSIKLGI